MRKGKLTDLVVRCMDYRFRVMVDEWIRENLNDQADLLAWPGVSKGLNDPHNQNLILEWIGLAVELHGVTTVHLMNHRDCGGHGGSHRHESPVAERLYHHLDLLSAARVIIQQFPHLIVLIYFMDEEGVHPLS